MKHSPEKYNLGDLGFYGIDETEIACYKEKLVKCRKEHTCASCQEIIQVGKHAVRESGFMDGKAVSCYTCTDCIDKWIDEIESCSDCIDIF